MMSETFRQLQSAFKIEEMTHQVVLMENDQVANSYEKTPVLVDALRHCDDLNHKFSPGTWIVLTTTKFSNENPLTSIVLTEPCPYSVPTGIHWKIA